MLKKELMALEFQYNMQLKGMEVEGAKAKKLEMKTEKTKEQNASVLNKVS